MDNNFFKKLIPALIAGIAITVAVGYKKLTDAPGNNIVEEIAEEVVKYETGIDVELEKI